MGLFTPDLENLRDLYTTALERQLSSERQIAIALGDMADKATAPQLKAAFHQHLDETKMQMARLERVVDQSTGETSDSKCKITAALISGAESDISSSKNGALRDVVMIAAANRLEHDEIAAYGTLKNWAMILGEQEHAAVLDKTLEEEKNADKVFTALAQQINVEAPVA